MNILKPNSNHHSYRLFVVAMFAFLSVISSFANQQENYLDSCSHYIADQNYQKASISLSEYLSKDITHRNIATFYLGLITYELEFNHRSEQAFLKFIELDKEHSFYYDSALSYLSLLSFKTNNKKLANQICAKLGPLPSTVTCHKCEGHGALDGKCNYCNGDGEDLCENCSGSGVIIEYSNFGSVYKTCPVCNGGSYTSCHECHGTGITHSLCHTCEGSGVEQEQRDCTTIAKKIDELQSSLQD